MATPVPLPEIAGLPILMKIWDFGCSPASSGIRKNEAASIRYARLLKGPLTTLRATCVSPASIRETIWSQKRTFFLPELQASSPLLLHTRCTVRNTYGAWNRLLPEKVFDYHGTKYICRTFLCPKYGFICQFAWLPEYDPVFALLTYRLLRRSIAK